MNNFLITQYISRMKLQDINDFAIKNGVILDDNELDIVFNLIKKDWRTIVYGNPRGILDELKGSLSTLSYQKIEGLYTYFKNKYSNYL